MKTEVILLAVIHRLHREVPFYTLDHLWSLLEALDPEVVCAEIPPFRHLTEGHLEARPELQAVILPYVRSSRCRLWSLESDSWFRSELPGGTHLTGQLGAAVFPWHPEAGGESSDLLEEIASTWNSPGDIYAPRTGRRIRDWLYDREAEFREVETMAWVDWNIYTFCRILEAVQTYPYRRIAAAVSAAQLHWLAAYLSRVSGIKLLTADQVMVSGNLLEMDDISFSDIPVKPWAVRDALG